MPKLEKRLTMTVEERKHFTLLLKGFYIEKKEIGDVIEFVETLMNAAYGLAYTEGFQASETNTSHVQVSRVSLS